jgi:isocitrate dehydrogenase
MITKKNKDKKVVVCHKSTITKKKKKNLKQKGCHLAEINDNKENLRQKSCATN